MYKSPIIERLVNVTGSEKASKTVLRSIGFSKRYIEPIEEFIPNCIQERSITLYLHNRKLQAKNFFFSQQLIKYDKLCLSLGIDAEFRNQKFEYDEKTGEEITEEK
jgi:hypothetical protein